MRKGDNGETTKKEHRKESGKDENKIAETGRERKIVIMVVNKTKRDEKAEKKQKITGRSIVKPSSPPPTPPE